MVPYKVVEGKAGDARVHIPVNGQGIHAAGDLGDDPGQAEGGRRGVPGRAGDAGGHHRAGLLQRLRSARRPRTPGGSPGWKCCASSTSRRRPRWPMGWTRRRTRRSWSSTWAAARSTCRCWRSATAWSKCKSTNGDTHLGGDDWDQRDRRLRGRRVQEGATASTCARTARRCSGCKEAAEKAKIELSSVMETEINLPFITADASGPKHLQVQADPREVRAADRGPAGALPRAVRAGAATTPS